MIRALLGAWALAIAAPLMAQNPPAPAPAGSLIGPALHVGDLQRALRFYVDGMGMKIGIQMGPPERQETILTFGGDPSSPGIILLADTRPGAHPAIEHGHGYDRTVLRMADLDAASARLAAAGFVPGAIRDVAKGYRMMIVTDGDGYRYELVERRPAPRAQP